MKALNSMTSAKTYKMFTISIMAVKSMPPSARTPMDDRKIP
jgi:hypothetical protein